ncbi:SusD/RagB family nutrient-binding outer membrane lipoprotein [Rufibacter immobilis]|uniref:SusD/RagB family nutrient-binding outer membrane lipoprotein n=1 Tax=Rufibacter immobilis TaxID=1348778 RepID=A0A3M9N5R3_9BACT|nr:SusD/RagB family nutrient-binding outer membrane lipoprotein [Rufibacter immobilis]RNI32338.1 SusD/RagB family nutrient-binding outer membrane lipoprotein [Rufibacter immobilis]
MKRIIYISLIAVCTLVSTSCENWLDVNTNPNGPDAILPPDLYLPQIQSELSVAIQWDARYAGQYTQDWVSTGVDNVFDAHGHPTSSDAYSQLWRAVYFSMGYNLIDMMNSAEASQKYDFVGVGHILKALGWQMLTDYHGEIILSEAFTPDQRTFEYDNQEFVYNEIKKELQLGIQNLERTDGIDANGSGLRTADLIYNGDRSKWIKFAYGLLAINANRLTNKSSYNPDEVITNLNKSFTSNADDALIRYEGTNSANANWYGPIRNNLGALRQSTFIIGLLNGTNPSLMPAANDPVLTTEKLNDPRIAAMMAPAPDGKYRGLTPLAGLGSVVAERPNTFWGTTSGNVVTPSSQQVYLFGNATPHPIMTYAMLQFIRAEAEWRKAKGASQQALDAYKAGVTAHIDFARQFAVDKALYDQRRTAYLGSEETIPTTPVGLTLSKIMLQKYIATWGWGLGMMETWSDFRRYHYNVDVVPNDGITTTGVYTGFVLPSALAVSNNGQLAYRARPRFNSEYMWNKDALEKIGGFDPAFHTFETWFSKPSE